MNQLMGWLTKATMRQKLELATLAGSSLPSIRLAAKGYRKDGELDISAGFAARLETSAANIPIGVPLKREALCSTCRHCPYQLKCNEPK
jgi:hypothetical protein